MATTQTPTPAPLGYSPEELAGLQELTIEELDNILEHLEAAAADHPGDLGYITMAMQVRDEQDAR